VQIREPATKSPVDRPQIAIERPEIHAYFEPFRQSVRELANRYSSHKYSRENLRVYYQILNEVEFSATTGRPVNLNLLWEKAEPSHLWEWPKNDWLDMHGVGQIPARQIMAGKFGNVAGVNVNDIFDAVIEKEMPNPSRADRIIGKVLHESAELILTFGPGFGGGFFRGAVRGGVPRGAGFIPRLARGFIPRVAEVEAIAVPLAEDLALKGERILGDALKVGESPSAATAMLGRDPGHIVFPATPTPGIGTPLPARDPGHIVFPATPTPGTGMALPARDPSRIVATAKPLRDPGHIAYAPTPGRWRPGEPHYKPMPGGVEPSWPTVRYRRWKNEALLHLDQYTAGQLSRMNAGQPAIDPFSGRPMELEHMVPQRTGLPYRHEQLLPVTPLEHSFFDRYRVGVTDPDGRSWQWSHLDDR
jgi:hypothetical protein